MSRDVLIKVENSQKIVDDNDLQQFKNAYQGKFYLKNEKLYLSYQDQAEGMDNSHTIVKIDPEKERVLLLRKEPAAMKQDFIVGEKKQGYYKTAYGEIKIAVKTKKLKIDLAEKSGLLKINYQLYLNGKLNAEHHLKLKYKIIK